jgi:hypothetical protein
LARELAEGWACAWVATLAVGWAAAWGEWLVEEWVAGLATALAQGSEVE